MTQPVRRRIEQPSAEKAKRAGCLMWGAVLGVLVGIMVGIYALPPILKHYYGETEVAADEFYRGDGKAIRVTAITRASDPVGEAATGLRREDFFARVVVVPDKDWAIEVSEFTLEFKELDDWVKASEATVAGKPALTAPAGVETVVDLHFILEFAPGEADTLTVEALHLSDPRVRFEAPGQ